ncbi:MAG: hypothetical protein ACRDPT_15880 [Streptomycetales bacterium]
MAVRRHERRLAQSCREGSGVDVMVDVGVSRALMDMRSRAVCRGGGRCDVEKLVQVVLAVAVRHAAETAALPAQRGGGGRRCREDGQPWPCATHTDVVGNLLGRRASA